MILTLTASFPAYVALQFTTLIVAAAAAVAASLELNFHRLAVNPTHYGSE